MAPACHFALLRRDSTNKKHACASSHAEVRKATVCIVHSSSSHLSAVVLLVVLPEGRCIDLHNGALHQSLRPHLQTHAMLCQAACRR